MTLRHRRVPVIVFGLVLCGAMLPDTSVRAWDSRYGNPTHSTHSYITEWAIDQVKGMPADVPAGVDASTVPSPYAELDSEVLVPARLLSRWVHKQNCKPAKAIRNAIVDGANTECHELPLKPGSEMVRVAEETYGIDLEVKRAQHRGTNAGCDCIEGWWKDSLNAYRCGNKLQAYYLLGIMLHMVEDMGVPAHANSVVHQAPSLKKGIRGADFDNFEALSFGRWHPPTRTSCINKTDPQFAEPWKYYEFSQDWTKEDAPNYDMKARDTFSKTWLTATKAEQELMLNRQARTCYVTKWALISAIKAYNTKE